MYDFGRPMQSSPVAITEMDASSGHSDIDVQQNSPSFYSSSPHSGDICSSLELAAASSDHAESPLISSVHLNLESRPKSPEIDVNARSANVSDIVVSNDELEETTQSLPTGVNDVFWEQFLTDPTPSSSGTQEVLLEE
ncbi:heat stress transcription factor A-4b-like [Apium graveolens]|uniref:heat stress transcription factor A-4b-like n=1 Tax=Apium graveolens TaxID=4045 RepID=UPI003D7B0596